MIKAELDNLTFNLEIDLFCWFSKKRLVELVQHKE